MNADGSGQRRLTRNVPQNPGQTNKLFFSPAWSPDGRKIAFQSGFTDRVVWVINADGSGQRNLTRSQADDHSPVFSRELIAPEP